MLMKRIIVYLFYVLLFISCKKKNDIEEILLDKNGRKTEYWDYYASEDSVTYEFLGYKMLFVSKNKYQLFYLKSKNQIATDYKKKDDLIESSFEGEWDVDTDKMKMNVDVDSFIIEKYNKDTIFMKGDGFDGKFMLIKYRK
ncbi:Uncharacterised protein [Myroides odoratus]|nr:hypothetical protein Myrod_0419 [Myroides odoratus DSM 2801]STZ32295.1 Uncharacterised protein [Myroides odoratus]